LLFICVSLALSIFILGLSYKLSVHSGDAEKKTSFECGFSPYETIKRSFEIRFYIIAILFILFDLEVSILFPWAKIANLVGNLGFTTMFLFFCILTLGLVYEWIKSALLWESLPPRKDAPLVWFAIGNSRKDAAIWGLQVMILLCAVSVVTLSNIVHSLISLIVTFVWCAILIINHQVSYLGLAFVTIYIGSISVLFIFVIMMLKDNIFQTKALSAHAQTNHLTLIALLLAPVIYVFGVLLQKYSTTVLIHASSFAWSDFCSVLFARFEYYDSISSIGLILYTSYSKHLIIASLVLLVGMVGSIVLVQFHPIPLRVKTSI